MLERLSQVREYAVRIFLSVMVSFIFFPGVILGQAIGHFGGELLYGFYAIWGLSLPEFMFSVGPDVISGLVGGALAAFACSKIYKRYHPIAILIFPALLSIAATIGPLLMMEADGLTLERGAVSFANLCVFIAFYLVLTNLYPTRFVSEQE